MAGPQRVPFKNLAQIKRDYRTDFAIWFMVGAAATWPLAIIVGKRAMRSQGGVAVAPYQRWIHNWPNVSPNRTTFRFFRRYSMVAMFVGGFTLARCMADPQAYNN